MKTAVGKIEQEVLAFVSQRRGYKRQEVQVGPAFGTDVAVIDLPDNRALAVTSDPLSLIPSLGLEESAWLSVQLMVNDIATTGFAPLYGQFVLNLPDTFSKQDFKVYWHYIDLFCKDVGIAITGGHTGFVAGQYSTIAGGGTLFTIAPKAQLLTSKNAQTGDVLLVTKGCALSSSAILALSFPEKVKKHLGKETFEQACQAFHRMSVLKDALVARDHAKEDNGIHAMHDVTEGGVLGAVYELARASGNGALLYNDQLPIGPVERAICTLFSIDPRYSIGAGAMIISCRTEETTAVTNRLHRAGIPCAIIGRLVDKDQGIRLIENGLNTPLPYYEQDPYWEAFYKAYDEKRTNHTTGNLSDC